MVKNIIRGSLIMATTFMLAFPNPSNASESEQTRMKKTISYIFEVVWNDADFSGLDDIWSEDVDFHFRGSSSLVGPDDLQEIVVYWRNVYPDFRFNVHKLIAEGDTVAARVSFSGTHKGVLDDTQPTNRQVHVTQMMFFRFASGKIVEVWEEYDEFAMRQQLGLIR